MTKTTNPEIETILENDTFVPLQNSNLVEIIFDDPTEFDTTRDNSPLKKAEDAITIDTTHLNVSEQVNMILEIINNNQENTNK